MKRTYDMDLSGSRKVVHSDYISEVLNFLTPILNKKVSL
jgi:hypothetical protein